MNKQNLLKSVSLFLIITFLFCGCNNVFYKKPVESEIFVMNTYISQKAYGKKAENTLKDVNTFLVECENKLSLYKENSYISKINKDAGNKPVKVDTFTFDLIEKSVKYCELTNGEFDITIAPLTKLWGITNKNPAVPDIEKIMKAKKLVNYKNIILDEKENTVFLKEKNMAIDLGGIAKGYICKNIKEIYEKNNLISAVASIGGNILTYKKKPNKSTYSLGIRDPKYPEKSESDIIGNLNITDKVVATSGAYERFFEKNGVIYHHIIDIKTGYPAKSDLQSITVVSSDGGLADFLSTTFFIMGKEKAIKYLEKEEFSLILIDNKDNIYISNNLKDKFNLTSELYKIKADI